MKCSVSAMGYRRHIVRYCCRAAWFESTLDVNVSAALHDAGLARALLVSQVV